MRGSGGATRGRHIQSVLVLSICVFVYPEILRAGMVLRAQPTMDKPKREAILDLSKYVNERIRVKFTGGREGM